MRATEWWHRFAFANGGVTYRNRWVRTQRWHSEREGGAAESLGLGTAAPEGLAFDDGVANTNVLMHGRRLLALEEAHLPIELDAATLGTRGQVDFGGALQGAFTARPKRDPRTGERLFFSYGGPDVLIVLASIALRQPFTQPSIRAGRPSQQPQDPHKIQHSRRFFALPMD